MKRLATIGAPALIVLAFLISGVLAQSGGAFDLVRWRVAGGGGASSDGRYTLGGTIGQHEARQLGGGSYTLKGGFWARPVVLSRTPIGNSYLPIISHNLSPTPTPTPTPTSTPLPLDCPENEPNDAPVDAAPLTVTGQACKGRFGDGDTVDLYKFTLNTQQTISIDLTGIPDQGDDTLALYDSLFGKDAARKPLCVSKMAGSAPEHIVYPNAAPGTYYIGIFLVQRSPTASDQYLLRVSSDNNPPSCIPPQ
jgi:Bacterial pre-peptidase C-terminal domain